MTTDTHVINIMDRQLKIIQWNAQGIANKRTSLDEVIRRDNAHIVMLQETLLKPQDKYSLRGYQTFRVHHSEGRRGCMMMIKNTIPTSGHQEISSCGPVTEGHTITVHLQQEQLQLYNLHCRQGNNSDTTITHILAQAASSFVLVAGDFNGHHRDLLERPQNSAGNHMGRHITELLGEIPEISLVSPKEPTHDKGGRLDLTFTNTAAAHRTTTLIEDALHSDHSSLITTIQNVNINWQRHEPKWNTKKADWSKFSCHISAWWENYTPSSDLDTLEEDYTAIMTNAAQASIPLTKQWTTTYKDHWYYNLEVKRMNKRQNQLAALYKRHPTELNRTLLKKLKEENYKRKRQLKEESWLKWCESVNQSTSLSTLWKKIHTVQGRKPQTPAHVNPSAKAEELATEFAERTKSTQLPPEVNQWQNDLREQRKRNIARAIQTPDVTDTPFTAQELQVAGKTSTDTAPGHDGITYSMINNSGAEGSQALLQLINESWKQGKLPQKWKSADQIPIPKHNEKDKHRPISLLPCVSKTMERMVLTRLKWKKGPRNKHIFGFEAGAGTGHCIANVLGHPTATIIIFLDIEKAFELANPFAIADILARKGIKGNLLSWIYDYLTDRTARVKFQGQYSEHKHLENGTPQGGVLSPTLFNVLMEEIVSCQLPDQTQVISYADDLAIVVGKNGALRKAKTALQIVERKCRELGLKVSDSKTKAMFLGSSTPREALHIQDSPIEWVTSYKYLGVWITKNQGADKQLRYLQETTKNRTNVMRAMTSPSLGASYKVLRTYYLQAVRSIIDYAAPVVLTLNPQQQRKLEVIQNNAMRTILGAPKWTKVENLRMETNLPPLIQRARSLTASLLARIIKRGGGCNFQHHLLEVITHENDHNLKLSRWTRIAVSCLQEAGIHNDLEEGKEDAPATHYTPRPPWSPKLFHHTINLPTHKKAHTTREELRGIALESVYSHPTSLEHYYTDGSVQQDVQTAGAAFTCNAGSGKVRLTNGASTLQTELVAIKSALEHALTHSDKGIVIHTDSKTAIQALANPHVKDNIFLTTSVLKLMQELSGRGRSVSLNWIPSHVGIVGNERADILAKEAAASLTVDITIPKSLSQLKRLIKTRTTHRLTDWHKEQTERGGSVSLTWYKNVTQYTRASQCTK